MSFVLHWTQSLTRRTAGVMTTAVAMATIATAIGGPIPAAAAGAFHGHGDLARDRAAQLLHQPATRSAVPHIPSGPACNSQFNVVAGANPGGFADVILNNAMVAVSPTDIWAVGAQVSASGQPDQTLAEHWNGSAWSAVSTPNFTVANNDFWGATQVATNNVWAVGDYTDLAGVQHPYAAQYTTSWTGFSNLPQVGTGNNRLEAAAAVSATNIWAVGFSRADTVAATPHRTLIEQYNGTTWSVVTSPNVTTTSDDRLLGIAAMSATDVWAVGISTVAGVTSNLIEHYNGTAWSVVTSPNASTTKNDLYGVVALSATNAYAVGDYADAAGRLHTSVLKYNGTTWSAVGSPTIGAGTYDDSLFSVSAASPTNIWAAGAVYSPTSNGAPSDTLVEHWDGTSWNVVPSPDGVSGRFNELNAVVATSASNVWVAGDGVNAASTQDQTLFENLCVPLPTVTGVAPLSGNSTGGTSLMITGTDFTYATGVSFGGTAASSFTINSSTQITATAPAGTAGTVDVTVTNYGGTSATSAADTYVYVPPAVSWKQYSLPYNDGSMWVPIDASTLSLTFTPSANSNAILSGNADMWTATGGVNQDLGILVSGGTYGSGTIVAWKESGGNAGSFSPNAAFVQTVTPVVAATAYTVKLVWKANHVTTATIFIAAGPGMPFSPTRLTAELVPTTNLNLQSASSGSQYILTGSNGSTWQDIDASALSMTFTPVAAGTALLSANADLWTQNAGVNQDIGIFVSGGAFGSGQIVGWKESGGNAGTFSPNAAFAQTVAQFAAATPYVIKLQWKTNHATTGTIRAGAGLGPAPNFSPTRLTLHLFPAGTGLQDASSNQQYQRANSTGSDWTAIDATNLKLTVTTTATSLYILSGNADLWTATAGINQDIGIMISGGAFGSGGKLIAWKESGGFAGTFSPNAAYVQTVIPLAATTTYTVTLVWKANHATGATIYAGAGAGPLFSPTRLTAQTTS
jgi:hypothetical protein